MFVSAGRLKFCTLTPSRRTGRLPASVRCSNCTARATKSCSSWLGAALCRRVMVVKSEYLTFSVTVRASTPRRTIQDAARRAISTTAASMAAMSVRSCAYVRSQPEDFDSR